MTPSPQPPSTTPLKNEDLAALWSAARRLHPIYAELGREFVIDVPPCADLEAHVETPGRESVEQAQRWLNEMDERVQVHQLRQFLQTSSLVDQNGIVAMVQYFLSKPAKSNGIRDKIDFLLVQYFSQEAPPDLNDDDVDLAYVARTLEPILGAAELKTPVWLNALDRVLDAARKSKSLDELLHGGVLEQGRKAKNQAGDLFYMPVALVAFTRFGYLMRRAFFRLMHGDLNSILDGLSELEQQGIATIDCRRAQFSEREPIVRLRMICQSWKVMFQAEYSSGQPLRMLVDLRASVEYALAGDQADGKSAKPAGAAKPAKAAAAAVGASRPAMPAAKPAGPAKPAAKPAAPAKPAAKPAAVASAKAPAPKAKFTAADVPEFEVAAATPEWNPESDSQGKKK